MNTSPIKLWKFNGGVHPPFHKEESNQTPITFAGIPDQLVLPLQQHIGEAAEPLVQVGDKVAKGQLIAHMESGLGANIHAPTSGKISVIEERPLPHISGLSGLCIVIDTDGKDSWGKHKFGALTDYNNIDPSELLTRIQQAGIVGLGGATFPTAVKLSASNAIKTLIINGAECEPYITCDDRLMRDKPAEIIAGIRILQTLLKPENCLIGIEDNKPEAIEALRAACSNNTNGNDKIEVVAIPTLYPSGGEKQLIEILTGQQVPVGGLPLDLGLIGLNVGTVYSIYKAIIEGEPLLSRIVTVTGNGINQPQNFEVLIGTSFNYLAEQAGGYTKMADHLIMGGPMMGFALEDDQVPVIKATNCALITSTTVLSAANSEYANQPTLPCIRCGKCMDVCPVKLLPQQMYWHIRAKDFEKAQDHNINDCIDCGCCSYVCPSHIPLVDYFRFAKNEIRDQQITQQKSDLSRDRHEFLLFRKEREKRERDEKRAAHKAALQKKKADAAKKGEPSKDTSKADAIKAAMARAKAKKEERASAENTKPAEKTNTEVKKDEI